MRNLESLDDIGDRRDPGGREVSLVAGNLERKLENIRQGARVGKLFLLPPQPVARNKFSVNKDSFKT